MCQQILAITTQLNQDHIYTNTHTHTHTTTKENTAAGSSVYTEADQWERLNTFVNNQNSVVCKGSEP